MEGKQLLQVLQYIAAWILIWCFVVFVLEASFVDFLLKYWLYFLIVSVSYFYYYSIQYEPDKKYELIRNVILYGNLYLFAHVFFRPIMNISHELFILLWLIILWIWWSRTLESRRKYVLQAVGCVFSFFIMISGIFYLYPDAPDVEWFVESRSYQIYAVWVEESISKKDAYLQIVDSNKSNDFEITPSLNYTLSENCRILYPSLRKDREEEMMITTPYGDVIWLFPQSEIQLEFDGKSLVKVSKLNGRMWFLSWVFDSSIKDIWGVDVMTQDQMEELKIEQYQYKYELVSHLKNQISESSISLASNTVMRNIDGKIIRYLARMFPTTFGRNLRNYNEFQKYFSWVDNGEVVLGRYATKRDTEWGMKTLWKNIWGNMRIGASSWNTFDVFKY